MISHMNTCEILKTYLCDDVINIVLEYLMIDEDNMIVIKEFVIDNMKQTCFIGYNFCRENINNDLYKSCIHYIHHKIKEDNELWDTLSIDKLRHRSGWNFASLMLSNRYIQGKIKQIERYKEKKLLLYINECL